MAKYAKYVDIVTEANPSSLTVRTTTSAITNEKQDFKLEMLKNLAESTDEDYFQIRENLLEAIAIFDPNLEKVYEGIVQAFDIHFEFPSKDFEPEPKPEMEPGDTLYIFQIPSVAGEMRILEASILSIYLEENYIA